ncbi:uncharacterized protein LOC115613297 isoform X2 [Strigops habroptila]|uniref:uncharacterized protein LOC115613297 isoform X2 n=1 Tax=Strigops habroptila TaxID=2489341 RepID=UPI0011CF263D|nr:uncharacterized protein LOC115613297 isoform X2 [Strigops habroptila]
MPVPSPLRAGQARRGCARWPTGSPRKRLRAARARPRPTMGSRCHGCPTRRGFSLSSTSRHRWAAWGTEWCCPAPVGQHRSKHPVCHHWWQSHPGHHLIQQEQLSATAGCNMFHQQPLHLLAVSATGPSAAQAAVSVPERSTASAPTSKTSDIMSAVVRRYSTGSQGPWQQPAAWQNPAQSRAAGTQTRRDTVRVANTSKAPATQPSLRNAGRAAEHVPAMPAAGSKGSLNSKSLGLHQKVFPQRLPPLPSKIKPSEQPKKSCLARAHEKHQAPLPPVALARASPDFGKQAPAQARRQAPAPQSTKVMDAALQVTAVRRGRNRLVQSVAVVQGTNQQRVEHQDMAQREDVAMAALSHAEAKDIESPVAAGPQGQASKAPLVPAAGEAGKDVVSPMLGDHQEQDSRAIVSSEAHKVEVAASLPDIAVADAGTSHLQMDLQSVSPAPDGPADNEPAAASPAGAAEEEQHRAALAAVAEEEEEAAPPASHGFDELEAEAEVQRKAFALLSPTASELVRHEIARRFVSGIMCKALAVIQEMDEQPQEHQEIDKSQVDVSKGAMKPAALEDIESPVAVEPQAEPSTAPLIPEAGELGEDMVSPMSGEHQEGTKTVDVSPAAEEEEHRAALAAVAQQDEKALAPASHVFDEQEAEAEARRKAFALLSPTASELVRHEIARRFVSGIVCKALAVIQEMDEQRLEQEDMAQSHVDVSMAPMTPATVQDPESSVAVEPQAEPSSAPLILVAEHEEKVSTSLPEIPVADAGTPHLAPGADDEGEAAASLPAKDSQHQEEPLALPAKEEKQCVEDIDNMLSHVKVVNVHNIWVNHLVPELFQEHRVDIQKGSSIRSSMREERQPETCRACLLPQPVPWTPNRQLRPWLELLKKRSTTHRSLLWNKRTRAKT